MRVEIGETIANISTHWGFFCHNWRWCQHLANNTLAFSQNSMVLGNATVSVVTDIMTSVVSSSPPVVSTIMVASEKGQVFIALSFFPVCCSNPSKGMKMNNQGQPRNSGSGGFPTLMSSLWVPACFLIVKSCLWFLLHCSLICIKFIALFDICIMGSFAVSFATL